MMGTPQYTPTGTYILPKVDGDEPTPVDPLPHFSFFERPTEPDPRLQGPVGEVGIAPVAASVEPLDAQTDWLRRTQSALPAVELDESPIFKAGDRLGKYLIGPALGGGGFAQVYAARHADTGAEVAIKLLQRRYQTRHDVAARLVSEGLTLQKVRSIPDIVQVHEVAEDKEHGVYLVMEWIRGESLRKVLREVGKFPVPLGIEILVSVCRTLGLLAEWDVVHRDLKPENIFLAKRADGSLRVVVLDLGCAKVKGGIRTSSNVSFIGTWPYLSPEQLGRGALTGRSDIYGLGCMAYELFEGRHAFAQRYAANRAAAGFVNEIACASWHVLHAVPVPSIPTALWNVIARAIEKVPEVRYQSAMEFGAALARFGAAFERGELSAEDLTPASKGGPKVRPAPKPLPSEDAAPVPSLRPRLAALDEELATPSLLVVDGPVGVEGHRFAIGREVTIGRRMLDEAIETARADILLPVASVSARHCRLHITLEGLAQSMYQVDDLDSTYGIEIAGVRLAEGLLRPLMTLRLGPSVVVELHGPGRIPQGRRNNVRGAKVPAIAEAARVSEARIDRRVSERIDALARLVVASDAEWEEALRRERAERGAPTTVDAVDRIDRVKLDRAARARRHRLVFIVGALLLFVSLGVASAVFGPTVVKLLFQSGGKR